MDYLFPDERERKLVLQFLAWCIRNPDKKIQHALLIIGRKGTGKSWLAKLLSVLFGPHNVSVLERGGVIADRFDTSAERKQLVFVDELVPDGKRDLIHAIEPLIVGTQVGIERKGKDRIWIPNRANIIAVTNKETAIRLTDSKDRKWLVVRAAEDARDSDYFKRLFAITPSDGTVTDEVRRVLWYLKTQVDLSDYDGLAPAPSTGTKDDVAESNQTSIAKQVSALRAGLLSQYTLVAFDDVRQLIATTTYAGDDAELSRQEADAKIAAAMEAEGCRRVRGEQAYLSKDRPKVRLWATSPAALEYLQGLRLAELAAIYRQEHEQPRGQGSIWFGTPGEPLSSVVPDFSEQQ
jgi:energy-coupling factor transporter ATP-binding protein EcfA2